MLQDETHSSRPATRERENPQQVMEEEYGGYKVKAGKHE